MTTNSKTLITLLLIFISKGTQSQSRKMKKIQQYIDEATAEKLSRVAV